MTGAVDLYNIRNDPFTEESALIFVDTIKQDLAHNNQSNVNMKIENAVKNLKGTRVSKIENYLHDLQANSIQEMKTNSSVTYNFLRMMEKKHIENNELVKKQNTYSKGKKRSTFGFGLSK